MKSQRADAHGPSPCRPAPRLRWCGRPRAGPLTSAHLLCMPDLSGAWARTRSPLCLWGVLLQGHGVPSWGLRLPSSCPSLSPQNQGHWTKLAVTCAFLQGGRPLATIPRGMWEIHSHADHMPPTLGRRAPVMLVLTRSRSCGSMLRLGPAAGRPVSACAAPPTCPFLQRASCGYNCSRSLREPG